MIEGTEPRMNKPGGGRSISRGEFSCWSPMMKLVSNPRLLVLPEGTECIECTEWPAELCLPSDLCDNERSVMGWLPKPLLGRIGPNSPELRDPWVQFEPWRALTSNRTLFARDAPLLTGSSSVSSCKLPRRFCPCSSSKSSKMPVGGFWTGPISP